MLEWEGKKVKIAFIIVPHMLKKIMSKYRRYIKEPNLTSRDESYSYWD